MGWIYQGEEVVEPPEWSCGFVYIIKNINTGKIYIGKKMLTSTRKTKIGKREIASTKTRKRIRHIVKDSGWKEYWSSCDELKSEVELYGTGQFKREILIWCYSKKQLSYYEMAMQVSHDVLRVDSYNGNICSHWYRRDLIRKEDETII